MAEPTANIIVNISASALLLTEEDAVKLSMLLLHSRHVESDWGSSANTCRWKYANRSEGTQVTLSLLSPAQLAELALKENT